MFNFENTMQNSQAEQSLFYRILRIIAVVMVIVTVPCWIISSIGEDSQLTESASHAVILEGELCKGSECTPALLFNGYFDEGSAARLSERLRQPGGPTWLCLESYGGNTKAARDLAYALRALEIKTCVVPRKFDAEKNSYSQCGSACAQVWLAGSRRVLSDQMADVGFHAARLADNWCCIPMNSLVGLDNWLRTLGDGDKLGDAQARLKLEEKSSVCEANELYQLKASEARALGLVDEASSTSDWVWVPGNPSEASKVQGTEAAKICAGKIDP